VSVTPQWVASEKITFSAVIARDTNDYVGSNPVGLIPVAPITQQRRDTITAETANMVYTPVRAIAITVAAGHSTRNSNVSQFHYNDIQASVNVVYKFFRYGNVQ
jgi:hypothetical protein